MMLADHQDPVQPPLSPAARWIELLFWVFVLSFAFDYRTPQGVEASPLVQMGFLGLSLLSSGGILLLGYRSLAVRPGAWVVAGWGVFLALLAINSLVFQAVAPGRFARVVLPFALCGLGLVNGHLAACTGIRLARLMTPLFVAAVLSVFWRTAHGFLFAGVTVDSVRIEILSPALTWLAAFIGCSLLLRGRLHWTLVLAVVLLVTSILLSVTRGLLFPVLASALGSSLAFVHGMRWRIFGLRDLWRHLLPIAAAVILGLTALALVAVTVPGVMERWSERLFSPTADRNMAADPSILSRKAEAEAIFTILNKEPVYYLHGRGVGASYYWDPSYLPELYKIYPEGTLDDTGEVWFAGHSIWTYALFSGGAMGVLAFAALFAFAIAVSFRAAAANAAAPGPDTWLIYLPMVFSLCILSQSITSNPFDERLLGLLFGTTIGLAQSAFVRASWIGAMEPAPDQPDVA